MENRVVEIEWAGPFSPEEVKRNDNEIYQFYGNHPVYGEDVLLYICRGEGEEDEWSGETVSTHRCADKKEIPCYFKPETITIRVGRIVSNKNGIPPKVIESMLVFLHSPAWNGRGVEDIYGPYLFCAGIEIKNIGEEGCLSREVRGRDCYVE